MNELQRALVADHIADLQREAATLRAERAEARAADADARSGAEPIRLPVVRSGGPRRRLGRWLVAIGTAIAGTTEPVARALEDCASDASDSLPHAA